MWILMVWSQNPRDMEPAQEGRKERPHSIPAPTRLKVEKHGHNCNRSTNEGTEEQVVLNNCSAEEW